MKFGLSVVLIGHVNFLLGALVHGAVLRHINLHPTARGMEYAISNVISMVAGLTVRPSSKPQHANKLTPLLISSGFMVIQCWLKSNRVEVTQLGSGLVNLGHQTGTLAMKIGVIIEAMKLGAYLLKLALSLIPTFLAWESARSVSLMYVSMPH